MYEIMPYYIIIFNSLFALLREGVWSALDVLTH